MPDSVHLGLPFIDAGQAQKHVTHNEALRVLDAVVCLWIVARGINTPPASPADGQRWLVSTAPTGAFAGQPGALAVREDGAWRFMAPRIGWRAWVAAENVLIVYDGAAWAAIGGGAALTELNNLTRLGVGTTADAGNPLALKLNNALFAARTAGEGGDGDLRLKMNKETAADTVSLLMQNNYSGRAEIGLAGDDRLRFKVSADGASWRDALVAEPATGAVSFPGGLWLTGAAAAPFVRGFRSHAVGVRPIMELDFADRLFLFHGAAGGPLGGALITGDLRAFVEAFGGVFTRASAKAVRDEFGAMVHVASGEPAYHCADTGRSLGLLIEQARTNCVLSSETSPTPSGSTVSVNLAMAPDGETDADKLVETAANTTHFCDYSQGSGALDNQIQSFSVFVKAGERTWCRFQALRKSAAAVSVNVDLLTGALGTVSTGVGGATSTVRTERWRAPDRGLWWRIICENVDIGVGATTPRVRLMTGTGAFSGEAGSTTFAGDTASGIFVWGAQIEAGADATSYIRTSGSAATRAAEDIWLPTGLWMPLGEGVLAVRGQVQKGTEARALVGFSDGTTAQRLQLRRAPLSNDAVVINAFNAAEVTTIACSGAFATDEVSLAVGFASNNYGVSPNGTVAVTDTDAITVPAYTRLRLGGMASENTANPNGALASLSVRTRRGTNAELAILSTQ